MSLGSQSNFLFGAASAAASGGFQIERSLRFNSGDSARLTRTPSSAGNRTTWTYSFWVKRSINALFYQSFLINRVSASYNLRIDDPTTPKFYLAFATGVNLTTTPIYRDPGAWMHVVIVHNSATTTSTDRLQLYVNGSRVTSFDSINYPTFNQFSEFNTTDEHGIGYFNANTGLDGYLTNVEFIDGRAVAPTDFGEFDANGLWQPKEYTGTFASTVTQTPSLDGAMIIKADGAQITGYVSGSGLKCLYTSSDGIDWTFQNREAVGPFQSDAKYLAIGAAGTNDITFFPGNGESFTYAMYSATTDFTTQSDITVDTTSLSYSSSGTTSYGANGFHLDFSDNSSASALGTDSSGNGNDWTATNFSVAPGADNDSLFDSPFNGTQEDTGLGGEVSGNYVTYNPLKETTGGYSMAYADGNLELSGGGDGVGTFPFGSGKKYFELTIKSASAFSQGYYGIVDISQLGPRAWATSEIAAFRDTGSLYGDGSTGAAPAASQVGDIIGFAVDVDNQKLFISINGTYLNSADPAAGTGFSFSGRDFSNYAPLASLSAANSQVIVLNAGQRPFAYAAPSEFKALNTANLDDPTILDGSTQVDVVTYIGNGTTQTISGLEFSPDLVWIKNRDGVYSHLLFDQIRGTTKYLRSDHPGGEGTDVNSLTAFTEDGFTVGSTNAVNQSAGAIVAWAWDTGSSTVENTDGSITSNVRANPSAGFSIVSYTGTGSNATVGHGLNAAPKFVVVKNKDTTTNWPVWHSAYSATDYTELNTTIAATTASSIWNNTEPTSTTFSVGTDTLVNQSTKAMIAYCWAPVEGYSAFGSLDPSNQPFIYTGFRPKYLLYKLTSTTGPWVVYDTERNPYNVADLYLQADSDAAEATLAAWDFLSNGFKIRTSFPSGTILYAAFAENPFKTARAR